MTTISVEIEPYFEKDDCIVRNDLYKRGSYSARSSKKLANRFWTTA